MNLSADYQAQQPRSQSSAGMCIDCGIRIEKRCERCWVCNIAYRREHATWRARRTRRFGRTCYARPRPCSACGELVASGLPTCEMCAIRRAAVVLHG